MILNEGIKQFRKKHIKPMMKPKKRRVCECKIRGIVELSEIKDDIYYAVHPMDYERYLRKFKYCPLCGKEIKVKEVK